jgi:hypothetical protein
VLSTPPAFVLSQDQTLQTKTPTPNRAQAEFESEKSDHKNKTPKTGIKNKLQPHPNTENQSTTKKQQTKTTKHTIEFSNNRLADRASSPRPKGR